MQGFFDYFCSMNQVFLQLCKQAGLPAPITEHPFAKAIKRKWRIDYYFEHNGIKLACEQEGGVYVGGRHTRPAGFKKDMEKYNNLTLHGIYLLRFTPSEMLHTNTIKMIKAVLKIQ
jgi:hypothetical protein